MEEASEDDLELATSQGTILSIDVGGVMYGGNQTVSYETENVSYETDNDAANDEAVAAAGALFAFIGGLLAKKYHSRRRVTIGTDDQPGLDNELLS
jgi:hypothetical protein